MDLSLRVDDCDAYPLTAKQVGRNLGESVEVIDGIKPVDKVVLNPSDSLAEGDQVSIAAATVAAPASGAKGSAKGEGSGALPTGSAPAASPASVAPTPPTQPSVPGDGRKAVPQTSLGNGMKLAHSLTTTSRAGTPAINAMAVDTPTNVAMRTNIATPTNSAARTNTATPTNVPALADATPARPAVR